MATTLDDIRNINLAVQRGAAPEGFTKVDFSTYMGRGFDRNLTLGGIIVYKTGNGTKAGIVFCVGDPEGALVSSEWNGQLTAHAARQTPTEDWKPQYVLVPQPKYIGQGP